MKNRYGIPVRVLRRNAAKFKPPIPEEVVKNVAVRDKSCVYCKLRFRLGARSRKNVASWEHIDDLAVKRPKESNVALCCGSCNASRGAKLLAEWFGSDYCKEKKIDKRTVAPIVRKYLRAGGRG